MTLRFRNWSRFQHYANRMPPWIKLHRGLLDDPDFHGLSPLAGKYLPLALLIASESNGELPPIETLAFRLRLSADKTQSIVAEWGCYLCGQDASSVLADCQQVAPDLLTDHSVSSSVSEGDARGTESEVFERFWAAWPKHHRKINRKECLRKWTKELLDSKSAEVMAGLERWKASKDWQKDGGQYIPAPLVWLNQERWTAEFGGAPLRQELPNLSEITPPTVRQ